MNDEKKILNLMCTWGFNPAKWGGIGFSDINVQNNLAREKPILAIYVTKASSLSKDKQGMVVGFVELSDETGHISKFISKESLVAHRKKPENKNRWPYAVKMSRAWRVEKTSWRIVDDIFKKTYDPNKAIQIGTHTKIVKEEDFANIKGLRIKPAKVYPQKQLPEEHKEPEIRTVGELFKNRGTPIE